MKGSSKFVDRAGESYGSLQVLRRGPATPSGSSWVCRCKCDREITVTASNLMKGQKACRDCSLSHNRQDLKGERFGRLLVYEFHESRRMMPYWHCLCDCGQHLSVVSSALMRGHTRSCGCLMRETTREMSTTHGLSEHPLYDAWTNMKQRCFNTSHQSFHRYGARGITICDRWLSFDKFVEDMLPEWQKGLTLERENTNGNYEPDNCVWATRSIQSRNKEHTIKVIVRGAIKTLPELADETGISQHTLWHRWKAGKQGEDLIRPVKLTRRRG